MTVAVEEYKGHPTIVLNPDAFKFHRVSFGLGKAKLILDNIQAIEAFVRTGGASVDVPMPAAEVSK